MEAAAAQLALLGTDTATLNREGIRTYLDIRAPRNGYVTNMDINAGKYFAAGDPVCDVIDKSKPMLQLTAYEKTWISYSRIHILHLKSMVCLILRLRPNWFLSIKW